MACGGTARTGRRSPEDKASCLLWRADPRLKPWGTQKQPQKAMAGTGKGKDRSRSLRDDKQRTSNYKTERAGRPCGGEARYSAPLLPKQGVSPVAVAVPR